MQSIAIEITILVERPLQWIEDEADEGSQLAIHTPKLGAAQCLCFL
jgi:hypothetical protein